MKKQTFKIGVASLAVTVLVASSSLTGAFAAKDNTNQSNSIVWNTKIVEMMKEQLQLIQNKHGVNTPDSLLINKVLDSAFKVIENKLLVGITPEAKPEVTPEAKPEVTPEVKPEVTPEAKPEVTPEAKPEVTPEAKPEVTPEAKPEVTPEAKPEVTPEDQDQTDSFSNEQIQVLNIVNEERTSRGLQPLVLDAAVSAVATEKARDMDVNKYFSHQSPTYGSPFDMLSQFGVKYSTAGENIASGQRNAEEVMDAWMNSTGHRNNILNGSYTKLGVGYVNGKWVQLFIG